MKLFFLIAATATLLATTPAQASVYATENEDGSWTVRKYDDGDSKVHFTFSEKRNRGPRIFYSVHAEKPGGLPFIGKTERMSESEFQAYYLLLRRGQL